MVFESQFKRNLVTIFLLGLVPDVMLSFSVAAFLDEPLLYGVVILLALQALLLVVWVARSGWGWLLFHLSGRKAMARHLCDFLHQSHFPIPRDFEPSAEQYFVAALENDQNDLAVRFRAAYELGSIQIHRGTGQVQQLLKFILAWETALADYRSGVLRTSHPPHDTAEG